MNEIAKKDCAFSCYLIGEDSLAHWCAQVIIDSGHRLLGICSSCGKLKDLASTHHIQCTGELDVFQTWLEKNRCDFLFSIVNSKILKTDILQLPRHLTINYHNAPLPKYAGVHATSWAILNNEKRHGVTWHVVDAGIDSGDILKQAFFPINKDDTNFSLDVKCIKYALPLFQELLGELATQSCARIKQQASDRSYYTLYKKPKHNGIISWPCSAEEIRVLYRASSYTEYENKLSLPKLVVNNSFYFPQRIQVIKNSKKLPFGTVIDTTNDTLRVATTSDDVVFSRITDVYGQPCNFDNLKQIDFIQPMTVEFLNKFERYSEQLARHESFWVEELGKVKEPNFLSLNKDRQGLKKKIVYTNGLFEKQIGTLLAANKNRKHALLTALIIYLYRLNNYDDFSFGYEGEVDTEINKFPFFSNIVPANISLNPNMDFHSVFMCVNNLMVELDTKKTFATDIVLRYPQLENYQVVFPLAISLGKTKSPCKNCLHFVVGEGKIVLYFPNNLDEINSVIVNNISKHLKVLVDNILHADKIPIKNLNLLSPNEEKLIIEDWNNTKTSYPSDKSLIEIFEQQVVQYPNNIAIEFNDISLTYKVLYDKVIILSNQLLNIGITNKSLVATCFDRGINAIISILSILKTGSAYVPIDVTYPEQYVRNILNETHANIILTQEKNKRYLEKLSLGKEIILLSLENLKDEVIDMPLDSSNLGFTRDAREASKRSVLVMHKHCERTCNKAENQNAKSVDPMDLAYVMYTSGSTGKPKGVKICHRAIARLVKNTNYIAFSPDQRIAQAANLSFDASTFEIWGALLNGATLVCANIDVVLNPEKFESFLQKEKIDVLFLTTALFNQHAAINPAMFRGLQYFFTGGEILSPDIMHLVANCNEGKPLHFCSAYGPTENTTFTTIFPLPKHFDVNRPIPIGAPIANTTTYVLDKYLNLMPIGIVGELYTGGDGLSLGYLNNETITKEKFVYAVFSSAKKRLYKTGDMAKWLPSGILDFMGRVDNQIKIRGFRIELEEIESCLLGCQAINQCVVIAQKEKENYKMIVAYVVPKNKNTDIATVRQYLSTRLPTYMIPSIFVVMDKLPLNQNGKVDKKLLPSDFKERLTRSNYIPPTTKLEKKIKKIWQKLLTIDDISVNDNFFQLGGNSLLITEMVTMIKKQIGVDFPFYEFIENPTIANITRLIKTTGNAGMAIVEQTFINDVLLDSRIKPVISPKSRKGKCPKAVLLTGATGFLGAHLLNDLRHFTNVKIYCLVREKNIHNACKRLNLVLKTYKLTYALNNKHVQIIIGDIAKPRLGLDQKTYDQLSIEIDAIYHCAAHVNHIYSYEKLYSANVSSTLEILKLASTKKDKTIHYISTLSTGNKFLDDSNYIAEDFLDAKKVNLNLEDNGYTQTKLLSEIYLSQANERGFKVFIYRPAWITGHSKTGIFAPNNNHLFLLIKGCVQIGYAPKLDANLNLIPVDLVSNIIVQISLNTEKVQNKVFNLASPFPLKWNALIDYLNDYGYKIKQVSPELWCSNYLDKIEKNNALYRLISLYARDGGIQWANEQNQFSKVKLEHTNATVTTFNLKHIRIDREILDRYFTFLTRSNFMPKIKHKAGSEKIATIADNGGKFLKEVVSCLPGNFYWKDKDGYFLGCSNSLLNLLNLKSEKEFVGKTDYDLWPEQAEAVRINDTHVMEADMQMNFEEMVRMRGRDPMFFTVIKMPFKDDDGNIVGIIGNSLDITYRKKMDNEKLATNHKTQNQRIDNYLKEIASCMPGNFYWKDREGRYLGCNKALLAVMRYSDEKELVGKTDYDLWPEQADALRNNDCLVMGSSEPVHLEETLTIAGSEPMFFAVVKIALRDAEGNVIGIIGNSLDITYRKENERLRTETAVQKAQLVEQEKFRAIANQVVHDIRSPLASLSMIVHAHKATIAADIRDPLLCAANTVESIAGRLLDLAKKEAKGHKNMQEIESILVSLTILEVIASKRYQHKDSSITFQHTFNNDANYAFIQVNKLSFIRMLSNLINNAVDSYEGKKGKITVNLLADNKKIQIIIQDNGKGMPNEVVSRVMKNIAVTSDKTDGHGIGMVQVLEALKQNNGKISIKSEVGHGTQITLTFDQAEKAAWLGEAIKLHAGEVVIVLDDDESMQHAWRARFKQFGSEIEVRYFTDGGQAIKFIEQEDKLPHDKMILLADFELLNQDVNGLQVVDKVKVKRALLVTSHYDNQFIQKEAMKLGVKILPKQLASTVQITMEKASLIDAVLVDDNYDIVEGFTALLKAKGKNIDTYYKPEKLLANLEKYPKDIKFFLDYNLGRNSINGFELAKQLYNAEYSNLFIFSGTDFAAEDLPSYLIAISKTDTDGIMKILDC